MRKVLAFLLAVCFGAVMDRLWSGAWSTAAADGGGGGVEECVGKNGDVGFRGDKDVSSYIRAVRAGP